MQIKPLIESYPPYLKLLSLIIIILLCMLFTSIVVYVAGVAIFGAAVMQHIGEAASYSDPTVLRALKFFQIISQMGIFIIPVIIFSVLASGKPVEYLGLKFISGFPVILLSVIATIVALPLINWLAEANARMHLPAALNDIEQWMKQSEADAGDLTNSFLLSSTVPGFIVNVFMMAVIPALGEELLFRGVLVRLFREWFRDIHVAIFISAFIFSAIHMQFYGFFPRLMMGVMFGYMFYWSGTIWVPVLAHFVNNILIVGFGFAYVRNLTSTNPADVGSTGNIYVLLACAATLSVILFALYRMRRFRTP